MNRPVFTIIAGSNGFGKSTLTSTARDKFQQTPVFDPDAIAKSLQTTLSFGTYLKMAARAKEAGFNLMVVFVGTAPVEINLERVKARVQKGGHDVREEDQRRRYPRALANMKRLLPEADLAVILDKSTAKGHTLVAFGRAGYMHWVEPVPEWVAALRG